MNLNDQQRLAQAMLTCLSRHWNASGTEHNVNAMRVTWTWAVEEFLLMEDTAGRTLEWMIQHHWPGPPVLKPASPGKQGMGHEPHNIHNEVVPQ